MVAAESRAPGDWAPGDWALRDWARSGAMALTGRADGPPMAAPGRAASFVRESLDRVADLAGSRTGKRPTLPDLRL
ncbi:MAG TPA: hypothetical protein VIR30_03810, partial [Nocardioides sp.]